MINEIVLESFINFCDDMIIAEESAIDTVKRIGQVLIEKIKQLIDRITVRARSSAGKVYVPNNVYEQYENMMNYLDQHEKEISGDNIKEALKDLEDKIKDYETKMNNCDHWRDKSVYEKGINEFNKKRDELKSNKSSYNDLYENNRMKSDALNTYNNYDIRKNMTVIQSSVLINVLKKEGRAIQKAIKENNRERITYARYRYDAVLYLVRNLFKPFK